MKPPKFHVGQAVVCVDGSNWRPDFTAVTKPKKGLIYSIREVLFDGDEYCLLLKEIVNPIVGFFLMEPAFRARRFAPVELLPDEELAELLAEALEPVTA